MSTDRENSSSLVEIESDSFFTLLSSEEQYASYIKKKIKVLDDVYNKISEDEAREKFFDIVHDFMVFGSAHNLKILNPIEFIKRYDALIPKDKLIDVYFSLNNYDLALEFIKLKKEELKECFKKYYIAPFEYESTDDYPLSDFEYEMIAERIFGPNCEKRKVYSLAGCYKETELKILLYRYFKDEAAFIFCNEEKNDIPLYGFCSNLEWESSEEILADLYQKGQYETIQKILRKSLSYRSNFISHLENKVPFNDFKFYGLIFLELIPKLDHFIPVHLNLSPMKEQEDFIRGNIKANSIPSDDIFSNAFIANLNFLKELPKKDLRDHPLYKQEFEVYFSFCRSFYNFDCDKYEFIFRRLFNRLIEGNSLFEMMRITNIEGLYHYYKTDEVVQFNTSNKISIDQIKSYITKQYFELKNILIKYYDNAERKSDFLLSVDFLTNSLDDSFSVNTIFLLSAFGFSHSKKMLDAGLNIITMQKIANYKYKNDEDRKKFLDIILKDLHTLSENKGSIDIILKIFSHLREENYQNITLKKIVKRVKSFEYALLPNVECLKDNLLLLDLVSKGEPIDNKIEGVKLYNDYRLREKSSIPDIFGTYQGLDYTTVDMHSPEIVSNGIGNYLYPDNKIGSSCLTPAGKAASCLFHGAINPHGRFFKVTIGGKIVAYSWLWRAGDVLCFDNIEITDKALEIPDYEKTIMDIYMKATDEFVKISTKEEARPIKVVICGKNKIDMLNKPFEQLKKVTDYHIDNFKPNNSTNLYLDDSKDTQYVLYGNLGEKINTEDVDYFYQYQSQGFTRFDEWSDEYLNKLINSIYFDYCLFNNKKYKYLSNKYVSGFIGEDWMIGYKEDGSYDLFYRTINERISKEIYDQLSINIASLVKKPLIITHNYEGLDYLLNTDNYEINRGELKEYLNSVRKTLTTITPEDYFHTPHSMDNFGHIIYDGAITSSSFGQHKGGSGTNGSHFICVASLNSDLFASLSGSEGFILDQNICAFPTEFQLQARSTSSVFRDSRYPIRVDGGKGELHVLDSIELNKVKGILVNAENAENLSKILYMLEEKELCTPLLIDSEKFYTLDKDALKRLIKLK